MPARSRSAANAAAAVALRVFGGVRAVVDGEPISLGGPQEQALVALLVCERAPQAVDVIVDALWPGDAPRTARKTAQVYLSRLRERIGDSSLERGPGGYRLTQSLDLDLDRFEAAVAQATAFLGDDPAAALTRFDEALAIASGRAFSGLEGFDFVSRAAPRIEERLWEARVGRWEALIALGLEQAAIPDLQASVREQPLRESLWRLLMMALYRTGRQAEALEAYASARRLLGEELGVEPGTELEALQRRILQQDPSLRPQGSDARRVRLPRPATRLVGRDVEVRELRSRILAAGTQLLTITGPGGMGKTTLALRTAWDVTGDFSEVAFLDLSAIRDPDLIEPTIAAALGVAGSLRARIGTTRTLLILDNLEQLPGAAPVVSAILADCHNLLLLATSRVPLRIRAEEEFRLEPLEPGSAIELLQRRVHASGAPALPEAVAAEICRRLDGIPLAIELAAARARSLSAEALLAELDRRLVFLTRGFADAPARQQTLLATIGWSFDLAGASERDVLVRLAIFRGGFDRAAALEVAGATVDDLAALVDTSLIRRTDDRYGFLELIHEFARDRLAGRDDGVDLAMRHAAYFRRLALTAPKTSRGLYAQPLDADNDNLRAALDVLVDQPSTDDALDMCIALAQTWLFAGAFREGDRYFERATERADRSDEERWADALSWWGEFARARGDYARARALYEVALRRMEAMPGSGRVGTYKALGDIARADGDLDLARSRYEQAMVAAVESGEREAVAHVQLSMGGIELELGRYDAATALFELAVAAYREPDARERDEARPGGLIRLAQARVRTGRLEEARALFREALDGAEALDWADGVRIAIQGVASLLAELGRAEDAVRLLVTSDALAAASGVSDDLPIEVSRTEAALRSRGADVAGLRRGTTPIPSDRVTRETVAMLHEVPLPTPIGR